MPKYEPDELEKLFKLSKQLIDRPTDAVMGEVKNMMGRLIEAEKSWEKPMAFMLNRAATRNRVPDGEIVVSETPVALSAEDSLGHKLKIVLEVAHTTTSLQLIGVLHADDKSPWADYTVLVSQDGVIEDFAEIRQGEDFTLQLKSLNQIHLKFISSSHEVLQLTDIQIDIG